MIGNVAVQIWQLSHSYSEQTVGITGDDIMHHILIHHYDDSNVYIEETWEHISAHWP